METAFITNIAFPKSLDEILYFVDTCGRFDIEEVLRATRVEWTAPRDARIGERAFFMHSKTSIATIRSLMKRRKEVESEIDRETNNRLVEALERGEALYRSYGGRIFAQGKVCGEVIEKHYAREEGLHWRSVYYAPIDHIALIDQPMHIDEFRDFIKVSRTGAITRLDREQEEKLLALRGL